MLAQAEREFSLIDADGKGMVLFGEFCAWAAHKHLLQDPEEQHEAEMLAATDHRPAADEAVQERSAEAALEAAELLAAAAAASAEAAVEAAAEAAAGKVAEERAAAEAEAEAEVEAEAAAASERAAAEAAQRAAATRTPEQIEARARADNDWPADLGGLPHSAACDNAAVTGAYSFVLCCLAVV